MTLLRVTGEGIAGTFGGTLRGGGGIAGGVVVEWGDNIVVDVVNPKEENTAKKSAEGYYKKKLEIKRVHGEW